MGEICKSGSMSGEGKRDDAAWPPVTAPFFDSTPKARLRDLNIYETINLGASCRFHDVAVMASQIALLKRCMCSIMSMSAELQSVNFRTNGVPRMAKLTLYHAAPSRSSIVRWMLEEIGEPYEIQLLSLS